MTTGLGSGLDTYAGIKEEATFGTPVTPDKFTFIVSESIKADVGKIESPYLGTLVMRTSQVKTYVSGAAGDLVLPLFNKGMGKWLKQCFGTTVVAQVGSTTEWTHTHTLDLTSGKRGIMATVQLGRASVDGTINPFTYEGGKVSGFTIAMDEKGLLQLTINWLFEDEKTATALAAASYATGLEMFDWSGATVTVAGVSVFVRSFSLNVQFAMDDDRRGLSQTLRKEPLVNGLVAITGEMAGEFESLTHYNSFKAGTQQALIATFNGSTIPAESTPFSHIITIPKMEFTGDTPNVGGPELLTMPLPFRGLYDGSAAPITLVQHTTDVAL